MELKKLLKISKLKINWTWVILGFMVGAYTVGMSYFSIRRHNAFASGYDLANMDQVVWQTLNGRVFQLTGIDGITSRFDFHADVILVLLSPFYLIWNDPRMLLIIQSVGLGLAAVPIFLIAKHVLKNSSIGLAISASYLVNPGLLWANMYDFHAITLSIPLLLTGFYFWLKSNWKWMWIFLILAMMTKENVGLWVMILGVVLIIKNLDWKRGVMLGGVGLGWFLVTVFIIMPNSGQGQSHWAWSWYKDGQIENKLVPYLYNAFLGKESIGYYIQLIKPFMFLPILGLPWLILAGPDMAINLLSSQGQMKGITMHYDIVPLLTMMIAIIFGLSYVKKFIGNRGVIGLAILMLVMALRQSYNLSPLPYTPSHWRPMFSITEDEIEFEKYLETIPKEAITTSSSEVRPHVNHRKYSYNLDNGVDEADYILMVDQNRHVGDYERKQFESELIEKLKNDSNYILEFQKGHFWGFKRK